MNPIKNFSIERASQIYFEFMSTYQHDIEAFAEYTGLSVKELQRIIPVGQAAFKQDF